MVGVCYVFCFMFGICIIHACIVMFVCMFHLSINLLTILSSEWGVLENTQV